MRTTLLSLLAMPIMAFAQDYVQPAPAVPSSKTGTEVNLGIGLGLDYGGIGGDVELLPIRISRGSRDWATCWWDSDTTWGLLAGYCRIVEYVRSCRPCTATTV
ncbi:MAG: hypothetical protein IPP33_17050 [Flavobacteriales bacterium]|nr:hypothetical protein [Flavobacteriales bacterium]